MTNPTGAPNAISSIKPAAPGPLPLNSNREVPFKDRAIGVAKKTRGTLLNNPELKQHGEQILAGTASVKEPAPVQKSEEHD